MLPLVPESMLVDLVGKRSTITRYAPASIMQAKPPLAYPIIRRELLVNLLRSPWPRRRTISAHCLRGDRFQTRRFVGGLRFYAFGVHCGSAFAGRAERRAANFDRGFSGSGGRHCTPSRELAIA